ncbi:MAG: hypothetical protein ACYDCK_06610 [Thermoplasmatota archaeon]
MWLFVALFFILPFVGLIATLELWGANLIAVLLLLGWMGLGLVLAAGAFFTDT